MNRKCQQDTNKPADETTTSNLCRICLEPGGDIPIFEGLLLSQYRDIQEKLRICFGQELPDLHRYPRNICQICYKTVNETVCFIKKFKESCKKLQAMIKSVDLNEDVSNEGGEKNVYNMLEPVTCVYGSSVADEAIPEDPLCAQKKSKKLKTKLKTVIRNKTKIRKRVKNKTELFENEVIEDKEINENAESKTNQKLKAKLNISKEKEKMKKEQMSEEPACCEYCGKAYTHRRMLTRHISINHNVIKPHNCPRCSKSYSTLRLLNRHLKRVHSEEKNFICSECGKAFVGQSELGTHYKSAHLKIPCPKKYSCKICGKLYTTLKSAITHERSNHTGERPAACDVCDARFYHEDYLKIHMRLHTGETPFKCPICSKGFSQSANMKSHIRHNHSMSQMDEITLKSLHPRYLKYMKP